MALSWAREARVAKPWARPVATRSCSIAPAIDLAISDGGASRTRRASITSRSRARPIRRRTTASAAIVTRAGSPTLGRNRRAIARASFSVLRRRWTRSGACSPRPGNRCAADDTDPTSRARQRCGQASSGMNSGLWMAQRFRPFAQGEFLHLAGRSLRDLGEHDGARAFVAREPRPAPFDQFLGGRLVAGLHLDEGAGRLAPFLVRPSHHGGELHARMLVQRVLDLNRRNVLPARDDDVLGPVPQLHIESGCCTPRSPEWNQPPAKALSVAALFLR